MTPIRLHALGATPFVRNPAPIVRPQTDRRPFSVVPFVNLALLRMQGDDHVVASEDGRIGEYAIGHLPPSAREAIRPPMSVRVEIAKPVSTMMLGIMSEKAIADIHDRDPLICPIAVGMIRLHAPDPTATIRAYIARAGLLNALDDVETSKDGGRLEYEARTRRLTVGWTASGWSLDRDRLEISTCLPASACVAALGLPVSHLIEHPAFTQSDAVVDGVKIETWGTEILYRATPIRARTLPEAGRRRG
jgi:hypothetical protein